MSLPKGAGGVGGEQLQCHQAGSMTTAKACHTAATRVCTLELGNGEYAQGNGDLFS